MSYERIYYLCNVLKMTAAAKLKRIERFGWQPTRPYSVLLNDRAFTQAELGQLFDENQDRHDKIYEAFVSKKA